MKQENERPESENVRLFIFMHDGQNSRSCNGLCHTILCDMVHHDPATVRRWLESGAIRQSQQADCSVETSRREGVPGPSRLGYDRACYRNVPRVMGGGNICIRPHVQNNFHVLGSVLSYAAFERKPNVYPRGFAYMRADRYVYFLTAPYPNMTPIILGEASGNPWARMLCLQIKLPKSVLCVIRSMYETNIFFVVILDFGQTLPPPDHTVLIFPPNQMLRPHNVPP